MKIQTINTIELTNDCNLRCKYCIQPLLDAGGRKREIMSNDVFYKSLELLKVLCDRGTQQEVNLNGNGESTLDPDLPERIRATKDIMGNRCVRICTNGVNMTYNMARKLKDSGLDLCDVSIHDPYHARRCVQIFNEVGMKGVVNVSVISAPHNWAGQLPGEHCCKFVVQGVPCTPLAAGYAYIQSNGNISPCCFDYRDLGTFANVFDDDVLEAESKPYELCRDCHQIIKGY